MSIQLLACTMACVSRLRRQRIRPSCACVRDAAASANPKPLPRCAQSSRACNLGSTSAPRSVAADAPRAARWRNGSSIARAARWRFGPHAGAECANRRSADDAVAAQLRRRLRATATRRENVVCASGLAHARGLQVRASRSGSARRAVCHEAFAPASQLDGERPRCVVVHVRARTARDWRAR